VASFSGWAPQIFILPYLDSIAGFTVLFVLVTALASWFMTSSPRVSYFGLQIALVRGVVSLPEFFRDGFTFHVSIGFWTRSGVRMPPTANTESQRWPSNITAQRWFRNVLRSATVRSLLHKRLRISVDCSTQHPYIPRVTY
jgi:hypothetical protein